MKKVDSQRGGVTLSMVFWVIAFSIIGIVLLNSQITLYFNASQKSQTILNSY